jgi:hypothetical protein
MTYFILSLLIQVALVVHVIKTGRNTLWIWVLVLLPLAGTLAYIFVEIVPGLLGTRTARGAARSVRSALDPDRELRRAAARASLTDTVAAKAEFGAQRAQRGDYAGAIETYRSGLKGLYEHDPTLLLGLAEAQFAGGDPAGARASLDQLRTHNPHFKSTEGHLLYARALEGEGNLARAESEFRALAGYYPGAEAKVRLGQLLRRTGNQSEARATFEEVLKTAELAPRHVRRAQSEWLAIAQRELTS